MVVIDEDDYLAHYGILRRSGRYPWGSGGDQDTRNRTFLDFVEDLKRQGLSEAAIAKGISEMNEDEQVSTTRLRALKSIAKNQQKQAMIDQAQRLKDKGVSDTEGARQMGIPGSTYRALLVPGAKDRSDILINVSEVLKERVAEDTFIDIGSGSESFVGISKEKLRTAATILEEQGYKVYTIDQRQAGTGQDTKRKVICPPGTTWGEAQKNSNNVKLIRKFSDDGGRTFGDFHPPIAVDPKRVAIKYKEDGGGDADGMIYVRPGVPDVSIGKNLYAQVRIQVGPGHYLKGMAVYKDDLPDGVDLEFHTNKPSTGNKLDAMKDLKKDKDLPFGSIVRQILADPGTPNERVVSAMNIVNEEANWTGWSKNISAQALSKQSPSLAKQQLNETYEARKRDLDEIMALTNPTVRKKLLESFADNADSSAVHLKAAALPKSRWHVILPIQSIKPTEIYAPNYNNGDRVALIRYPHGGTFEIPELVVNNKNREAKRIMGSASAAVGIHTDVAKRLSGADFDGDTVLVIPNNEGKIKSSPALQGLKDFDPIKAYPGYDGMPKLTEDRKQTLMGEVSNLITDMTIKGASHDKLVRAVRHSMVIIDAEKHDLNYKESEIQNGIKQLKREYQVKEDGRVGGASTLISRSNATITVPHRRERYASEGGRIDEQGRKVFVETGRMQRDRHGNLVPVTIKSKRMAETDDAFTLSSGTPVEKVYAEHANRLKTLANQARVEAEKTPRLQRSTSAAEAYKSEVSSLENKLAVVIANRPLERQAQAITSSVMRAKIEANPNITKGERKKLEFKQLTEARRRMGIESSKIVFTDKEWEAIQAGAISDHKLRQMLDKADLARVRDLSTPKAKRLMTSSKIRRAQNMLANGFTRAEVAAQLGVSLTTLDRSLDGEEDEGE